MKVSEYLKQAVAKQHFWGKDVEGWMLNGIQELQQAVQPAFATQVGPGNNLTIGSVTSGEVTAERLDRDHTEPELE